MKRIGWVDIMKGIGIITVIIGHTYTPFGLNYIIYSFHMPLFFLISGYFWKERETGEILKRGLKNYIKPYLLTVLL